MRRRTFVQNGVVTALGFGVLRKLEALGGTAVGHTIPELFSAGVHVASALDNPFAALRNEYFLFHLSRNPVTSTYLGGDAYDAPLRDINSRLRDYSHAALMTELRYYTDTRLALSKINPRTLSPAEAVDHAVMDAQLGFLTHQLRSAYEQKSLDTYVAEPFRGIDWQIQQMTDAGSGLLGTEEEWELVIRRLDAVPGYVQAAEA